MSTFIFPLLFSLIPVAIVALIIALIAYAIKRKDKTTEIAFTPHFMLKVYTYIILLASVITFSAGLSLLINSGLAQAFGEEFSFQAEYVYDAAIDDPDFIEDPSTGEIREVVPKRAPERYEIPLESKTRALIQGITMTIISLIIGLVHLMVLKSAEPAKERKKSVLYRLFVTIGLGIYAIGSLVALPVGIYATISYFVIDQSELELFERIVPGESLASAIVYVPLWILFIWLLTELRKGKKK